MIDIGIIGGSGYTGGELIRLLLQHPKARIRTVTSRRLADTPVADVHRHLAGLIDLDFATPAPAEIASECEVVFTAVPHGAAMDIVPKLLAGGTRVIDLSADYRLPQQVFEETYKRPHTDPRDGRAVFGLPELHRGITEADLVANPGCYPTGAILSAAPLASEGSIEYAIFDSKSGVSGAGVDPSATSHYPNLAENVRAYNITTHRHLPEIVQELSRLDHSLNNIYLTPHVVPAIRGILTTAHLILNRGQDYDAVLGLYNEFYRAKPFVRVRDSIPDLSDVRGSNFCDIGIACGGNRVVVISAIDNLVKGASGQAVQNMNLMFGLHEITGLLTPPLSP
ncbi:MAG: N-acetyl-gamma-glutamyl-phosphate reductase [Candidatus Methanogaster sp.]|uniref:N-acetyl-gamma-glutamyl-phosphate reductase n=1 Tax=Candidatus Methanogaster sp. TaxID=3386292 RepID=A0AC61L6U1_9EURY|nr:MAG: N-acetyl-gamma-glutamyl-phosphate reductase [ANME-2 cluster archaeon]